MEDYHGAFAHGFDESRDIKEPEPMRRVAKKAATASWKSLAAEDLEGTSFRNSSNWQVLLAPLPALEARRRKALRG